MITTQKLCIVAGSGKLPVETVKNAVTANYYVLAVALSDDNFQELKNHASSAVRLGIGQAGKIFALVQGQNITQVMFIGKVHKKLLFENIKFDLASLRFLKNLTKKNDDSIMLSLIKEIEKEGITVLDQTLFLQESLDNQGVLGIVQPTPEMWEDIQFGFETAKEMGRLDIGQTVVVKDKMVMAIEAIEGTDSAIERGCKIARKEAVVVKVSKPAQDLRFDVPTIGVTTLEGLKRHKGKVLAFEAGKTILVDKEAMIQFANTHQIVLVGV